VGTRRHITVTPRIWQSDTLRPDENEGALRTCAVEVFRTARAVFDEGAIHSSKERNTNTMISWAITFLIIALIAAVLGFGGIAGTAVGIAKILFFVFLVLFVISLLMGRRTPPA